jgi:uncharacterized protein
MRSTRWQVAELTAFVGGRYDRVVNCPTCRASTTWHGNVNRPFCSLVCRLIDLGTWLDERYRIPSRPSEDEAFGDAVEHEVS